MARKRLIPKLQLMTSSYRTDKMVLVITRQFHDVTEIGDAVSQSKIYQDQGADELIFINIDRENKNIRMLAEIIHKVSEEIFMPITVGGGVSDEEHFRILLANGADKISMNTAAVSDPSFISLASAKYGAQCVVISIDYKLNAQGQYRVYTRNGTEETNLHPVEWAIECEKRGAGELLLSSISHDGMRDGLDITLTKQIADAVGIPVITSGGCGLAQHFAEGYLYGHAHAVAAGTFFAHRDQNFMQTRSQIKNAGVDIRVYT